MSTGRRPRQQTADLHSRQTANQGSVFGVCPRVVLFEFVELFYNPVRQHSHLKGLSPMQFERAGARLTTYP